MALLAAFGIAAGLAACSRQPVGQERVSVSVIADPDASPSLSVARLPLPTGAALLRAATARGLVGFDAAGRVSPALAARWIVTDDGLSYIFRLGDERWNDGRPISARDVARAFAQRQAEVARHGRFGAEMASIRHAVAMTDEVLEIDLDAPRPGLLQLLAQPEMGLLLGAQGSGAMTATGGGDSVLLRPREFDPEGREQPGRRTVTLATRPAALAMTRFVRGLDDVVLDGRFQHLPLLAASGVTGGAVQVDPAAGLFGFRVERAAGLTATPELREALAMAIDRPRLLSAFSLPGWQEAVTIVPTALTRRSALGRPGWAAIPIEQRRAIARARLASALQPGAAPLRIALPEGAGSRILFARIAADLAAVGVPARRVGRDEVADLRLVDEVAGFDSPLAYLARLSCDAARLCDAEADALIARARTAGALAERAQLAGQAEIALTRFGSFIPLAGPVRFSLVRPGLVGFAPNPRAWHLLQYLGASPTSR